MVPIALHIKAQLLSTANRSPELPSPCLPPRLHPMPLWSLPGPHRIFLLYLTSFLSPLPSPLSNKHLLTCQASA